MENNITAITSNGKFIDHTARARVLTTLLSINAAESGDEDTPPSLQ